MPSFPAAVERRLIITPLPDFVFLKPPQPAPRLAPVARKDSSPNPPPHHGFNDVIGIVLICAALFFLITLFSYDPYDLAANRVPPNQTTHNWAGPLGDKYTNQNIYSLDHSVLAQWLDGKLLNVWPKSNAEINVVFPDPTVKR